MEFIYLVFTRRCTSGGVYLPCIYTQMYLVFTRNSGLCCCACVTSFGRFLTPLCVHSARALWASFCFRLRPMYSLTRTSPGQTRPLSQDSCVLFSILILSLSKRFALHPFQTERQHVTSDGPGQDAGDRVLHLHPDLITHRHREHHEKHRV